MPKGPKKVVSLGLGLAKKRPAKNVQKRKKRFFLGQSCCITCPGRARTWEKEEDKRKKQKKIEGAASHHTHLLSYGDSNISKTSNSSNSSNSNTNFGWSGFAQWESVRSYEFTPIVTKHLSFIHALT